MKVTVTPVCRHWEDTPAGRILRYSSDGEPFVGKTLDLNANGVWVDDIQVIRRDRRPKAKREAGHPWTTSNNHPDPRYRQINWTSFTVDVEP